MHNEDGSRRAGGVYMSHIESFSTIGLEPRRKLAFWNDRASESFSPLVSEPEDIRVFNGSIVRGSIGDMTLAEVYSDAQIAAIHARTWRAPRTLCSFCICSSRARASAVRT